MWFFLLGWNIYGSLVGYFFGWSQQNIGIVEGKHVTTSMDFYPYPILYHYMMGFPATFSTWDGGWSGDHEPWTRQVDKAGRCDGFCPACLAYHGISACGSNALNNIAIAVGWFLKQLWDSCCWGQIMGTCRPPFPVFFRSIIAASRNATIRGPSAISFQGIILSLRIHVGHLGISQ